MSSQVLAYGQSEYVRQFGMTVDSSGPLKVQARILRPPTLKYGPGSKQLTIVCILFPLDIHYLSGDPGSKQWIMEHASVFDLYFPQELLVIHNQG